MFGFVVASASALSDEEKTRYRAVYCGLCRALGKRYGQASRAALTYDLTFYILLANSLTEPAERTGESPCIMHPVKKMPHAQSRWTDYAADLSVALAYHKCLDDIADDNSLAARAGRTALESAYRKARERIPDECTAIEKGMEKTRAIEGETPRRDAVSPAASGTASPDAAAREFGALLGTLFARGQGYWAGAMEAFGQALGRFIYLMDAAVDFEGDAQSGSYNPFIALGSTPEAMRTTLELAAADTAESFERLPLEQDLHLLRSVLYEGVWIQFNHTYLSSTQ